MQIKCICLIRTLREWGVAIINFNFDAMRRYEIPEMVLCNPDKKEICMMKGLKDVQLSIKWQACCELTFTAYSSYNGIKSEYYNKIEKGRLIHVIGFGYFVIQNYDLDFDNKITTKSVTAYSAEYLLNFKDVNLVFVTTPTSSTSTKVISKSYKFYDTGNPQGTLLYELMSICPQWKINYVSQSLMDKRRSFNATDDGLYGFLCNTVAESYEAVFIFDYEKYTVSAYDKDDILKDSDIILTFDNILKNCKVEELSSDTYTVLNVSGADTLSIASINPTGSKKLYKFDYYVGSLDPNSEHYYVTYNEWVEDTSLKKKVLEWQDDIKKQMYLKESDPTYKQSYGYLVKIRKIFYKLLLTQKAAYTDQKTYCEAAIQRMGIYQGSTAEIGQKNYSIQQKREAAFEANMIAIQNGGNFYKVNDDGTTEFKYVILNDIDENAPYSQIWSITALQSKIDAVDAQRDVIVSKYAFENYFTAEEVAALEPYIKEAEYSDSSFILTDTMKITDYSNGETWVETTSGVKQIKDLQSDDVIIDETYICLQLLDAGYSRFDEIYQPSFSFTADAVNFLFTDRFKDFAKKLTFGTVLNVELEDGYWVYPCFQGVDINFDDATSFSISFSNRLRLNTSEWTWADLHSDTNSAVSSTISLIGSAATPVTNGTVDKINNYMSNTLVAANQPIQATADNEFTFGSYGIRGRRVSKETTAINGYDPKQIWINNNQICFTDDAWKTTKLIIGDAGDGEYGVVADYLVGALNISDKLSFTNENRGFRVDSDDAIITNCTIENTRITSDSSGNKPHSKFSLDEIFLNNVPISTISGDYTISIDGDNGLIVKRNSTNTNIMTSNSGGMYASIFGDARAELNSGEFGYYYNNTRSLRIHNNTSGGVEAQFGISGQNCIYIRSGSSDSTLVLHNGTKTTLEANSSTGKLTVASIECTGDITVDGDLTVTGTESRVVNTSFGKIKMYSYGTPLPSFGDYGVGVCDENGECLITLDPKFSETISKTYAPVWQITPYNKGEMWIEQAENSATVHGVSGQKFSWWVCAPQNGYDNSRAEVYNNIEDTDLNNNTLDKEPLQALVCEQTKHLEGDTPNLLSEV